MLRPLVLMLGLAIAVPAAAQHGLFGDWREQGGGTVRVAPCATHICITLIALPPNPPSTVDNHDPIVAMRSRPLCGMRIGTGFQPRGPANSPTSGTDGRLYDPRSGKTYRGEMTLQGDTLHLRGFVGIRAFGRSETWTRTSQTSSHCAA